MPNEHLPLLVFPRARVFQPDPGRGVPIGQPHAPTHERQIARLRPQVRTLVEEFDRYKASIAGAVAGMEPETVLVMEIAGTVDEFKQAIEATGLEWLGEWDVDDIEATDDFYEEDSQRRKLDRPVKGRMFLSMSNGAGLRELLNLWEAWQENRRLPFGKTKWRDVFNQLVMVRRWGITETLRETGMIERWRDVVDPLTPEQPISFQIELFYRRNPARRRRSEVAIRDLLAALDGRTLGAFIDLPEIAFHAVKGELPGHQIRRLLEEVEADREVDIELFKFSGIMYFRPTGQSLAESEAAEGEHGEVLDHSPELPPVAAILDGAPMLQHEALKDRLLVDDPFGLEQLYGLGDRKHGTSIASLVVHGDLSAGQTVPLRRKVFCVPVMQPDTHSANRREHIPDEVFFEDRIHIAVRRMLDDGPHGQPLAPSVNVINVSIGDPERPFIHTPSPWARLLDWLSWKYRVLFCVSAGNCDSPLETDIPHAEFAAMQDNEKVGAVLGAISRSLSSRRVLSPAESLNALTIGATHSDESGQFQGYQPRTDLLPCNELFSPASRLGHGFRKSIKPEILFPGGRQYYKTPIANSATSYAIDQTKIQPGQKVAWDSTTQGALTNFVYTRGTSNATALATRSAIRIHEMLEDLRQEESEDIPDGLTSVLMKALLVHGARHSEAAKAHLNSALRTPDNSRRFKEVAARYIGYGAVDIERALRCTEQRATVLGYGEISGDEIHEFSFPLPIGLTQQRLWRRLVITLAWLTPINPDHRNLREAKLNVEPGGTSWQDTPLRVTRQDADHHQVLRGTVQHEVLEASDAIAAYQDGDNLLIRVICKKDATNALDDLIPYGLAVTLEVKEDVQIPVYQQIKQRIKPQVVVGA